MEYKPYDYQNFVTKRIIDKKKMACLLEMGLGKTIISLTAIDSLVNDYLEVSKVLVIAPKRVVEMTWPEELQKWSHLKNLRMSVVLGDAKKRVRALDADADLYAINRENTEWLVNHYIELKKWPFQMIVVDESSSFKNRASNRFKALRKVTAITPRVILLTGTPAPNSLMDLWSQIYLLDQGERLGRTITEYRGRYFVPDKRSRVQIFSYKLKDGAEHDIYAKLRDLAISMKSEDYVTMPERIDNVIKIRLDPESLKLYREMEREYLITVDEETITAKSAGAVANKLLQMANGAVYTDKQNKSWVKIHDAKLEVLRELMDDNEGKPVMVFYDFNSDRDRLLEYFKDKKPVILDTPEDKKRWDEGKIQMLLAHPASTGHGLNLQAGGNIVIWFGLTWNLEQYQQGNARLYGGLRSKRTVIINHLIVEGSVDERVMERLKQKKVSQDDLIEAVKARIREIKGGRP